MRIFNRYHVVKVFKLYLGVGAVSYIRMCIVGCIAESIEDNRVMVARYSVFLSEIFRGTQDYRF